MTNKQNDHKKIIKEKQVDQEMLGLSREFVKGGEQTSTIWNIGQANRQNSWLAKNGIWTCINTQPANFMVRRDLTGACREGFLTGLTLYMCMYFLWDATACSRNRSYL
jgi:hypothetical protein